jgi:hypothetical protein
LSIALSCFTPNLCLCDRETLPILVFIIERESREEKGPAGGYLFALLANQFTRGQSAVISMVTSQDSRLRDSESILLPTAR